ncbi:MAG: TIGR00266 family protein [Firmicutes bacterium]|nr:TIGR00266 family protein [Bacillota bacterium]
MKYEITGDNAPAVICTLENGESMITEGGSMAWMSPNMEMQTSGGGSLGKAFGRMLSGERVFQNIYTARGGQGMIAFAPSFPGQILALDVTPDHPIILQKRAFLASESGVELSTYFQKKGMVGFFGGEGFIMQKVSGRGKVFIEIDGSAVSYKLGAGEQIIVDTGSLAAMDASCSMDIVTVKGAKNVLFGGEGLFNTVITGPGNVTLQTVSFTGLVNTIAQSIPSSN